MKKIYIFKDIYGTVQIIEMLLQASWQIAPGTAEPFDHDRDIVYVKSGIIDDRGVVVPAYIRFEIKAVIIGNECKRDIVCLSHRL